MDQKGDKYDDFLAQLGGKAGRNQEEGEGRRRKEREVVGEGGHGTHTHWFVFLAAPCFLCFWLLDAEDERVYGFVRFETGDEMSKRAKFALITWVGPKTSVLKKAKVSTDKAFVKEIIQVREARAVFNGGRGVACSDHCALLLTLLVLCIVVASPTQSYAKEFLADQLSDLEYDAILDEIKATGYVLLATTQPARVCVSVSSLIFPHTPSGLFCSGANYGTGVRKE